MIIFLCEPSYEGILSGIYDAGISKIPKNELRLELKNESRNLELFAHYRDCESSESKGAKDHPGKAVCKGAATGISGFTQPGSAAGR